MPTLLKLNPVTCSARGCKKAANNVVCWKRVFRGKVRTRCAHVCDAHIETAMAAAVEQEKEAEEYGAQ